MRYTVRKSVIQIVGKIWLPYGAMCTQEQTLTDSDVENCRDDEGNITRESVEDWLGCHSGDFSEVVDFWASLEVGNETVEIDWATEEGECAYLDASGFFDDAICVE